VKWVSQNGKFSLKNVVTLNEKNNKPSEDPRTLKTKANTYHAITILKDVVVCNIVVSH
jgi:hypothetical protein